MNWEFPVTKSLRNTVLEDLPDHCFHMLINGMLPSTDSMLAGILLQLNDFLEFNELLTYACQFSKREDPPRFAAIRTPPFSTRIIERALDLGAPMAYVTYLHKNYNFSINELSLLFDGDGL